MLDLLMLIGLQLLYVPVYTIRTIMLVKGNTRIAVPLGFLETLIYIFGVSIVLTGEQSFIQMAVYSIGFSIGIYVGSLVEQKLAVGYTTTEVNTQGRNEQLVTKLRESGYGVTVFEGAGRDGLRTKLEIVSKRSKKKELAGIISELEPNAFVVSYEPNDFKGGYLTKSMRERKVK